MASAKLISEAEYLEALADTMKSVVSLLEAVPNSAKYAELYPDGLFISNPGCHGGTWGHPKLAVYFARWLDVKCLISSQTDVLALLTFKAPSITLINEAGLYKLVLASR